MFLAYEWSSFHIFSSIVFSSYVCVSICHYVHVSFGCLRRALYLTFELVNKSNVRMMNKELLEFLADSDNRQFREYVTSNIFAIAEKYVVKLPS